MQPQPTGVMVMTDYALQQRLINALEANNKLFELVHKLLSESRLYETEAAVYLGVEKRTLLQYRKKGLPYEKVGNVISYLRKDLDAWRSAGKTQAISVY